MEVNALGTFPLVTDSFSNMTATALVLTSREGNVPALWTSSRSPAMCLAHLATGRVAGAQEQNALHEVYLPDESVT